MEDVPMQPTSFTKDTRLPHLDIPYMVLVTEGTSSHIRMLGSFKQFMSANNQLQLAMKQIHKVASIADIA